MNTSDQTKTYGAIGSQMYTTFVDAFAASNQRMLGFAKSYFEIVTRPYTSTAIESAMRENFDRANQLVDLTVVELQHTGTHASKVAESIAAHSSTFGDQAMETARGHETFASRVQEMQQRTSPSHD